MPSRPWLSLAFILATFAPAQQPPYLDTSLSPAERAHSLVGQMTLDEKASQLEDWATAIPRLGIPDYQTWNEALHGVARAGYSTVFPQAIGMGATWDPAIVHAMGNVISTEARAKYNEAQRQDNHRIFYGLTFWSPNINIFRDPRWGRGQETYGEDPFLTARLGVAFVTGVQGDDLNHLRAVATSKHFAVHSGPETLRHGFNVNPPPRDREHADEDRRELHVRRAPRPEELQRLAVPFVQGDEGRAAGLHGDDPLAVRTLAHDRAGRHIGFGQHSSVMVGHGHVVLRLACW